MILKKGSKGKEVGNWQKFLNSVFGRTYPALKIDEDFGDRTRNATRRYQYLSDLEDDGVVGKNTILKAIKDGYKPMEEESKLLNAVIDISHYQYISNWEKIEQAGIKAVIHKATQGTSYVDNTFIKRKNEHGDLLFGAYHFGTGGSVKNQVENFLSVVDINDLMVLDYEPNPTGSEMNLTQAKEFIKRIYDLTGKYVTLYSGSSIKADLGNGEDDYLKNCPLWISHYTTEDRLKYPANWDKWTLWQYTDKGKIDGIVGNVDRNYFNGTEEELKEYWSK